MESKNSNNLFFVCSLIEYIARKTNNTKEYIVKKMSKALIEKIYSLAEVYHSDNIDKVSDEIISECQIKNGNYDIFTKTENENLPSYWDMGRVYQRLIAMCSKDESEYIDKLLEILTSWIIKEFDNYDSSLYYENPSYIYECYREGKIL